MSLDKNLDNKKRLHQFLIWKWNILSLFEINMELQESFDIQKAKLCSIEHWMPTLFQRSLLGSELRQNYANIHKFKSRTSKQKYVDFLSRGWDTPITFIIKSLVSRQLYSIGKLSHKCWKTLHSSVTWSAINIQV